MSLFNLFTTKSPTVKQDFSAYSTGGKKTYDTKYTTYVESVESLDKAIRAIANIASMANIEIMKETTKGLQPLKVKNVDFKYNTNDQESSSDMISMIFGSIFTQGAAVLLSETNKTTKFQNFFVYDISRFRINATEQKMISSYTYSSESGTEVEFKPEDVIYIAPRLSASNLLYVTSRLKPLNDMLILQANLLKQTNEFYAAGGKNSAIISPKEPMSKEKAEGLKTAFDSFLQTPATKTLFINTEVDVESMSNSQTASQIMDALTRINQTIVEQFGIPAYIFGDYKGYVSDAAVVTACRLFFQVHMKPVFRSIEYQFTRYFRSTLKLKDAVVTFNFDDIEILEDNLSVKIEDAGKMYKLGLISMNEARARCDLDELPDEAANYHNLPAYLVGQKPIAIERYEESMAEVFADPTQDTMPAGNSGGTDNQNVETGSTGGPNE